MLVFADRSFLNYFTRCFCCRIFLRDSIIFTKVDCLWMTNKQSCKQTKYLFLPALLPHTKSSTSRLAGNILFIFTSFIWFKISFNVWQMKLRFFKIFFYFSFNSDVFEVESKSSFKNAPEGRFWEEHAKRVWPITSAQRKEDLVAEIAGQIVVTWWW